MLSPMNNITDFTTLVKNVKHAVGKAKSLNIVFNRIHHQFAHAIKGTGMSRACYTVTNDNGSKFVMKVEHNTHTNDEEWAWLSDANMDELESFKGIQIFPNLASVLMPIHAWFTVGNSLILIVPLMDVVPNINTGEWKNSEGIEDAGSAEWKDVFIGASSDMWRNEEEEKGPRTMNGKRMQIMHWLNDDVHEGNVGIKDGLIYLIDYNDAVVHRMSNKMELLAEKMFA
jgi:hypothetical protein